MLILREIKINQNEPQFYKELPKQFGVFCEWTRFQLEGSKK